MEACLRATLAVMDRVWDVAGGSREQGMARRRSWWRNDGRMVISEATGLVSDGSKMVSDESDDELHPSLDWRWRA